MKKNKILFLIVFLLAAAGAEGALWPFGSSEEKQILNQARQQYTDGQYEAAVKNLELFLVTGTVKRREKRAYILLGQAYEKLGRAEKALNAYLEGVELNPKDTELKLRLGALYENTKLYSRAIDVYNQVYEKNPSSKEALLGMARCYGREGFFSKAEYYFALYFRQEAAPGAVFWADYAYVFYKQKLYNEALYAVSMALREAPGSAENMFLSAKINRGLKNSPRAYDELERALKLAPRDEEIFYTLVYWLIEDKNYTRADALLKGNEPLDLYLKFLIEKGKNNNIAAKKYLKKILDMKTVGFINDMAGEEYEKY